jgi:excisionase family DNA binding protein
VRLRHRGRYPRVSSTVLERASTRCDFITCGEHSQPCLVGGVGSWYGGASMTMPMAFRTQTLPDALWSSIALSEHVNLAVPSELIETVARQAAALVLSEGWAFSSSPWMTRQEAAEYLRLPLSRLEKDRQIPFHKDGGRVLYHRVELDAYMLGLGAWG